jgi:hypothetical protein
LFSFSKGFLKKIGNLILSFNIIPKIVLQMENCSDGFNVPREHTAKLYIVVGKLDSSRLTPS